MPPWVYDPAHCMNYGTMLNISLGEAALYFGSNGLAPYHS